MALNDTYGEVEYLCKNTVKVTPRQFAGFDQTIELQPWAYVYYGSIIYVKCLLKKF